MNQGACRSRNRPERWRGSKADAVSNPKDAKHDHPVLSITSHSLGFGGLLATSLCEETLTVLATLTDVTNRLIGKDPDSGKDRRQEKGMTGNEVVQWHH